MYESPIIEIMTQMEAKFTEDRNKARENQMMLEVKEAIGYEIDKEELLKALQYDRDQYDKGFRDAQPKWIPVSERLPEKTGLYLISIGDLVTTTSFDGHNFRTQAMVRFIPDAWMPLPEPYKEGEEE